MSGDSLRVMILRVESIVTGVSNGGTTAEDPPGPRQGAAGQIYLAYLRDPDGNKLVAVHRMG